jgi:hypothetical protein
MSEIKVNKISPATSTDITLGDSGDTFTVPSGATIVNSGTATGFGGGGLLQFKQAQVTDASSRASSLTWGEVDTDLRVVITPTLSTSKILVILSAYGASTNYTYLRLVREESTVDTVIAIGDQVGSNQQRTTSGNIYVGHSKESNFSGFTWLDAPASTNELTYKVEEAGHDIFYLNQPESTTDNSSNWKSVATFTAMEIAVGVL